MRTKLSLPYLIKNDKDQPGNLIYIKKWDIQPVNLACVEKLKSEIDG